jgi:hypothetical protein
MFSTKQQIFTLNSGSVFQRINGKELLFLYTRQCHVPQYKISSWYTNRVGRGAADKKRI